MSKVDNNVVPGLVISARINANKLLKDFNFAVKSNPLSTFGQRGDDCSTKRTTSTIDNSNFFTRITLSNLSAV